MPRDRSFVSAYRNSFVALMSPPPYMSAKPVRRFPLSSARSPADNVTLASMSSVIPPRNKVFIVRSTSDAAPTHIFGPLLSLSAPSMSNTSTTKVDPRNLNAEAPALHSVVVHAPGNSSAALELERRWSESEGRARGEW